MKNKKGFFQIVLGLWMVWAVLIVIGVIVFAFSGGLKTTYDIGRVINKIPTWGWIVGGVMALLLLIKKR